jgi:tyrosyl-tRNA synthetase
MVGFSRSNSEARKSVLNGAIKINDQTITDPSTELSPSDIKKLKLSFGKKKHLLLNLDD